MDVADVLSFAASNHRAVLQTYRADGTAQLSPITVGVDVAGDALDVSSRETAYKVRNLRRDPRASVCLLNDGFFGEWAYAEGAVDIVSLPDAMDGLVEYYRRISGEHPDWDDYRAAMVRDQRVLIRLRPSRVGPTAHG
jgi:PPOX class probable F420-dependent enzyme